HVTTRAAVLGLTPRAGEMVVATADGAIVVGARGARRVGEREGLLGLRVKAAATLAGWAAYAPDLGATPIDAPGVAGPLACGAELSAGGASAIAWGPGGKLYLGTAGGLAVASPAERAHVEQTLALGAVGALAVGTAGLYAATPAGVVLVHDGGRVPLGGP